jgi:hypothetical protein
LQAGTIKKIYNDEFCCYYQAKVVREQAWFFVAIVRSCEHMMFDRTVDVTTSKFEFFVPQDMVEKFLSTMCVLEQLGVVTELTKSKNRLSNPDEEIL